MSEDQLDSLIYEMEEALHILKKIEHKWISYQIFITTIYSILQFTIIN